MYKCRFYGPILPKIDSADKSAFYQALQVIPMQVAHILALSLKLFNIIITSLCLPQRFLRGKKEITFELKVMMFITMIIVRNVLCMFCPMHIAYSLFISL